MRRAWFVSPAPVAQGTLRTLDGYSGCVDGEQVLIQRHGATKWATVTSTGADGTGGYSVDGPARSGVYRARMLRGSFDGHVCLAATTRSTTWRNER